MSNAKRKPVEVAAGPGVLDLSRFSPANRRRLSGPGLRTFLSIADLWGLTEDERLLVLGLPSRSTYYNWIKAVREHRDITLDLDMLTRISAVLGVHQVFARSVTMFQIAISMGAISALTRRKRFWLVSLGCGVIGLIFFIQSYVDSLAH